MSCEITRSEGVIENVLADNGMPSKLYNQLKDIIGNDELALQAWAATKTVEFKDWFGDSKFVDNNGEPMLLFHGTPEQFDAFNTSNRRYNVHNSDRDTYWFTDDIDTAKQYGGNVIPVYLASSTVEKFNFKDGNLLSAMRELESKALDDTEAEGVIFDTYDKGRSIRQKQYVVFSPLQIKSINNEGTFSSDTDNIFKQVSNTNQSPFNVGYQLKSVNILMSDKAKQTFVKGEKNGWSLDKILTELAIPKEQKQIILNLEDEDLSFGGLDIRESIVIALASKYNFNVEINTAKEKAGITTQPSHGENIRFTLDNNEYTTKTDVEADEDGLSYITKYFKNSKEISSSEYYKAKEDASDRGINTSYYSNLSAPGGTGKNKYEDNPDWEYLELEFKTPLITPSIKGHAQFATEQGIGWARVWYNKKTGTVEIQEIQSDLFQKGRDRRDLVQKDVKGLLASESEGNTGIGIENPITYQVVKRGNKYSAEALYEYPDAPSDLAYSTEQGDTFNSYKEFDTKEEADKYLIELKDKINKIQSITKNSNENQFLQLLNKDSNWVTFFIKSIIQDSAKKGYKKVLFPKGDTASKVEGHTTLEEFKKEKEARIKLLEEKRDTENKSSAIGKIDLETGARINYDKQSIESINIEIEQLKQELERVETEGFAALRPIYKFYENIVTNILKKQGFNPVLITDEYGNTWNEVEIKQEHLDTIFLQKKDPNQLELFDDNGNTKEIKRPPLDPRIRGIMQYAGRYVVSTADGTLAKGIVEALRKSGLLSMKKYKDYYHVHKTDRGDRYDYSGYKTRVDNLTVIVGLINERIGADVFKVERISGGGNNHFTALLIDETNSKYVDYENRVITALKTTAGSSSQIANRSVPIDPALEAKMREIMSIMNISQVDFEEYKTLYRKKYGKSLDAIAVADIMNRMIAVDEGRADGTTLTEEVGHFVVFSMLGDSSIEKMLGDIHTTDEWQQESEVYMKEYNGDERKVRIEILGKVLTNAVRSNWTSGIKPYWQIRLKSLWRKFMSLFGLGPKNGAYIKAEINDLAQKMLNLKVTDLEGRLQKGLLKDVDVFKQVDHTKYADSKILNSRVSDIDDAIKVSKRKIKYYEDTENDVFINKETKLLEALEAARKKGQVTLGILKFVESVRTRAEAIDDRLRSIRSAKEDGDLYERMHIYAGVLDEMYNYVQSYKDLIASMMDEYGSTDTSEMSDPDKMVYADMMEDLKNISKVISNVDVNYKKYAKELITSYVKPVLLRNPKYKNDVGLAMADFMNSLEEGRDVGSVALQVKAMSTSGSDILSALDSVMKREIESASLQSEDLMIDVLKIHEKYGNIDTSFMYEKHKGMPTGNIISEINYGMYHEAKKNFIDSLRKKHGENPDDYDVKTQAAYDKELNKWFSENKEKNPDADIIKADMKARIIRSFVTAKEGTDVYDKQMKAANEEYVYWLNTVEKYNVDSDTITYRGTLSRPAISKYGNPDFDKLNTKQREYYNDMMNIRESALSDLSSKYRYTMLAPQTRKDWLERLKNGDFVSNTKTLIKETVMHTEDDVEFVRLDESGRRLRNIPVHFFNRIENPNDLSLDFTGGMILMIDSATRHKTLRKSLNMLELTGEILNRRKIISGKQDSAGNTERTAIGGNTARRFQEFVEMNYFGQMKFKGDEFLGMNTAKLADTFSKYVALNTLALNLYAGVNNVVLGNIQIREESVSGEYVNSDNIKFANNIYWDKKEGVFSIMSEVGKLTTQNKLKLFLDKVDALQDHKQRIMGSEPDRGRFKRLANTSTAFFTTHMGEHQMASKMALALADSVKLTDADGKSINLYEAFEVKNNKLVLKDRLKRDGKDFTNDDLIDFRIRLGEINRKLHGVYNETDRNIIQRTAIGRLIMQFRKYFVPSFDRRWATKRMNYALNSEEEGFYMTAAKIMKRLYDENNIIKFFLLSNDIPFTKRAFASKKEMLDAMGVSDMEKANMIRAIIEMNYMMGAMIAANLIAMALGEIDDDDEPLLAWTLNSMAYQSNRLSTELGAWVPIWGTNEMLKLLQSPMAGMNTIDNWMKVVDTFDVSDAVFEDEPLFKRYERGRHKGDLKLWVWTQHRVPMIETIGDWFYPEDKNRYWQL